MVMPMTEVPVGNEPDATLVALVLVSHSRLIAEGTKELAQVMAPGVHISAVAGNPDGGLGSSYDMIESVIRQAGLASGGMGVAVLTDLGSTTLTVESVIEFASSAPPAEGGIGDKVRLAPGPLVEGAVAAAVAASQGESLDAVVQVVADTAWALAREAEGQDPLPAGAREGVGGDTADIEVVVGDPAGLHARTAAVLARKAATYDAKILVGGALATSVVDVMARGFGYGQQVIVHVEGDNAAQIAEEIASAIAAGFDAATSDGE